MIFWTFYSSEIIFADVKKIIYLPNQMNTLSPYHISHASGAMTK